MWKMLKHIGKTHRKRLIATFSLVGLENLLMLIYPVFGGWAINAHAKINIPLGSSLTKLASLPKNARLAHLDPFAEKKKGRNIFIAVLILLLAAAGVFCYFYLIKKTGIYPFNLK